MLLSVLFLGNWILHRMSSPSILKICQLKFKFVLYQTKRLSVVRWYKQYSIIYWSPYKLHTYVCFHSKMHKNFVIIKTLHYYILPSVIWKSLSASYIILLKLHLNIPLNGNSKQWTEVTEFFKIPEIAVE